MYWVIKNVMNVIYELCMYLNPLLIIVILIIVHSEFHLEIPMLQQLELDYIYFLLTKQGIA
jgi:hypothetical protein